MCYKIITRTDSKTINDHLSFVSTRLSKHTYTTLYTPILTFQNSCCSLNTRDSKIQGLSKENKKQKKNKQVINLKRKVLNSLHRTRINGIHPKELGTAYLSLT